MTANCKTCTLPAMTLRRVQDALLGGEGVEKVAARFSISAASLYRHRLNHMPGNLKDIRTSEAQSAFDAISSLVDALTDIEQARIRAAARGQSSLVLRLVGVQARVSKQLFSELDLDSVAVAERLRTADSLQRGLFALIRKFPTVARSLADEMDAIDPNVAAELRSIHETALTDKEKISA